MLGQVEKIPSISIVSAVKAFLVIHLMKRKIFFDSLLSSCQQLKNHPCAMSLRPPPP